MEKRIFDESDESRLKLDFRSSPEYPYSDWQLRSADSSDIINNSRVDWCGSVYYNFIVQSYGILSVCTI